MVQIYKICFEGALSPVIIEAEGCRCIDEMLEFYDENYRLVASIPLSKVKNNRIGIWKDI